MINKTIESNIGLVKSCVSKFHCQPSDYEDVFQAGCLGLIRATKRFSHSCGVKFSTYAVPFILGEIKNFFHDNSKIKINKNLRKNYFVVKSAREFFCRTNGREPTLNETSAMTNLPVEAILESLNSQKEVVSYDDISLPELKSHEKSHDERISNKIDVHNAIRNLSNMDKKILNMRFFQFKTQTDSAKILGMTQVQISRREKKILKFLRSQL